MIWSAPIIETPAPPMAEPSKPAAEKKPASIEIEVPADATLFVDGQAVPGTGAIRSFSTPELVANKAYYYDMKAEVAVNGVVQREELRVVVRGGETLKQTFGVLIAKAKANSPTGVAQK